MAEIKNKLTLDGSDTDAQLKRTTNNFVDSFEKIRQAANKASEAGSFEGHAESAHKFREILHVLHPILGEAGVGIGELGAFARVAAVGTGGLAAAIGGTLLVSLVKVADETEKTRNRIKALGGGEGGFEDLTRQAQAAGVQVKNLQPLFEKSLDIRQRLLAQEQGAGIVRAPGNEGDVFASNVRVIGGGQDISTPSKQTLSDFDLALQREGRTGNTDINAVNQGISQFKQAIAGRGLTPEALLGLKTALPQSANLLTQQFRGQFGNAFATPDEFANFLKRNPNAVSESDVYRAGAGGLGQATQDFEKARGLSESFENLKRSADEVEHSFSKLAGSKFFNEKLDQASAILDSTSGAVDKYGPSVAPFLGDLFSTGGNLPVAIAKNALPVNPRGREAAHNELASRRAIDEENNVRRLLNIGENPVAGFADGGMVDGDGNPLMKFLLWLSAKAHGKNSPITDATEFAATSVRGAWGGHISGPGGPRGDKIPAMLSDGEFVVNAKSTSKWLPFLHKINGYADGGPVDPGFGGVLDFGSFSRGVGPKEFASALAKLGRDQAEADSWQQWSRARDKWDKAYEFIDTTDLPKPEGYASGGMVGGGNNIGAGLHPVTLSIGGRSLGGLYAHPDALSSLTAASVNSQAVRTGSRPSWWRGD